MVTQPMFAPEVRPSRSLTAARSVLPSPRPHTGMDQRADPPGDFAHLLSLKHFAMLTSFRAFAPKAGEFRLLPTQVRGVPEH